MSNEMNDLIAEARRAQNAVYLATEKSVADDLARIIAGLADAFEAATRERATQAERVSMEVLNEYRRIAAWLESQAALRGVTGDTMHGLAAEALTTLIDHEYSRHTIPLYGMLDVWMALYGKSHPDFDKFYDEHGYAEAWSQLLAEIRFRALVPDATTELEIATIKEHREKWMARALRAEAERDAALAAIERVREVVHALRSRYADNSDAAYFASQIVAALDGAPEPEWEYEVRNEVHAFRSDYTPDLEQACQWAQTDPHDFILRRRKAGPWLPVEGEKP